MHIILNEKLSSLSKKKVGSLDVFLLKSACFYSKVTKMKEKPLLKTIFKSNREYFFCRLINEAFNQHFFSTFWHVILSCHIFTKCPENAFFLGFSSCWVALLSKRYLLGRQDCGKLIPWITNISVSNIDAPRHGFSSPNFVSCDILYVANLQSHSRILKLVLIICK